MSETITLVCAKCGAELETRLSSKKSEIEIAVYPCERCMDEARAEGRGEGYDEGYEAALESNPME